ncbi:hypothetical protein [Porphyromonas loveana]|uniref:hypothetical protein n=1 Tax=Porphyromonas loveana TaxID=1884669 RepID=UPI0035A0CEB4
MTALVNSAPTTALQRIGLLLRMEWSTQRNSILAITGTLSLIALAISLLVSFNSTHPIDEEGVYGSLFAFFSISSITVSLYTFLTVQRRVNHSNTIAYTLIPASTTEKFIALTILFLIPLVWMLLLMGIAILLLALFNPETFGILRQTVIELFVEPHIIMMEEPELGEIIIERVKQYITIYMIISTLWSLALALWSSISVRGTTQSLLAYMGIGAALSFIVSIAVLPAFFLQLSALRDYQTLDNMSDREALELLFSPTVWGIQIGLYAVVTIAFFVWSYYSLKRRQLR